MVYTMAICTIVVSKPLLTIILHFPLFRPIRISIASLGLGKGIKVSPAYVTEPNVTIRRCLFNKSGNGEPN